MNTLVGGCAGCDGRSRGGVRDPTAPHSSRPFTAEAIRDHVDRQAALDDAGRLIAAGPLADGSGGIVLARFDDLDDALAWAAVEPFVIGGWETVEVRTWIRADRSNAYLDPTLIERRPLR